MQLDVLESTDIKNKKIQLKTEPFNGYINISVADNGPGIPDSIKDDILKPFFTTRAVWGSGLLYAAQTLKTITGEYNFTTINQAAPNLLSI